MKQFVSAIPHRLWLVIALAAVLRLWQLSAVPPSPSLDEVSLGYNAYSLLHTGRDEYGTSLPLLLRAYDDYRPALYAYTIVPFLPLLGLSVLAVRLPAVILSLITIGCTFFLIRELFPPDKGKVPWWQDIAFWGAFLLAISPWNFYLSRLGHEVNLGLTLVVTGMYCFLRGVKKSDGRFLVASAILFGLSFDSYQSEKLVVPVLLLGLGILYGKKLWQMKQQVFLSLVIGFFVTLPSLVVSLSPQGMTRLSGTSAFTPVNPLYRSDLTNLTIAKVDHNYLSILWYNRRLTPVKIFVGNYVSHFKPDWLFTGTAMENHKIPHLGLLFPWEAVVIILGLGYLLREKKKRPEFFLLIVWFLAAPIPAAITTQAPHALRTLTFLPVYQIFGALGIVILVRRFGKAMVPLISVTAIVSIVYMGYQYFIVFPQTQSSSFQYALMEALPFVKAREPEYEKIVVANRKQLLQSYMFYLFANQIDPSRYQKFGGTVNGGFSQLHWIGKYEFRGIENAEVLKPKTLYVVNEDELSGKGQIIQEFANLDGKNVIKLVRN